MGITLWQYYTDRAAELAQAAGETPREELRRAFMRSMGLDPLPARCDLKLADHGALSGQGYRARKVAFQILPDCYATGAVFYPDPLPPGKCPGVLYLCEHGSLGLVQFQGHPIRWARRGYACLILDTLEQHDNPGEHHGLFAGLRPDWLSMGYSAAGGELWNSLRGLDVLASLPEVDPERLGVTGVSGGGAMSLFVAIADERIRAVASSCGVSIPRDALRSRHLLGHCDCMYGHNYEGVDVGDWAGLVAPRPALFSFSAQDVLFSPEESEAFVERARCAYRRMGCEDRCAYLLCPGPHGERPEALAAIDRWFDRHVAGEEHPPVEQPGPELSEEELTVFNGAPPEPNRLDLLPELLSTRGRLELPRTPEAWPAIQRQAIGHLREAVFGRLEGLRERATWDRRKDAVSSHRMTACRAYGGQIGGVDVWLETVRPQGARPALVCGVAGSSESANDVLARVGQHAGSDIVRAAFEPRGSGFSAVAEPRQGALLRAAALAGLSPVMLMVQDIGLMLDLLAASEEAAGCSLFLYGRGEAGVACLYRALLDPRVAGVVLEDCPVSHRRGAPLPGILRVMDLDQAVGLMAPRPVALAGLAHGWRTWAARAYGRLGVAERLILEPALARAFERIL